MKTKTYLLTALTAIAFPLAGQADDSDFESVTYGGLNYALFDINQGNISAEPEGFRLHLGHQWHPNLAIELHYGFGANEDVVNAGGNEVAVDIDTYYGLYLRGLLPMGENFHIYGLAGYGSIDVENISGRTGNNLDTSGDEDYGYGVGAEYKFTDILSLSLEYMRLMDASDIEADALSFGLRFDI